MVSHQHYVNQGETGDTSEMLMQIHGDVVQQKCAGIVIISITVTISDSDRTFFMYEYLSFCQIIYPKNLSI